MKLLNFQPNQTNISNWVIDCALFSKTEVQKKEQKINHFSMASASVRNLRIFSMSHILFAHSCILCTFWKFDLDVYVCWSTYKINNGAKIIWIPTCAFTKNDKNFKRIEISGNKNLIFMDGVDAKGDEF